MPIAAPDMWGEGGCTRPPLRCLCAGMLRETHPPGGMEENGRCHHLIGTTSCLGAEPAIPQ